MICTEVKKYGVYDSLNDKCTKNVCIYFACASACVYVCVCLSLCVYVYACACGCACACVGVKCKRRESREQTHPLTSLHLKQNPFHQFVHWKLNANHWHYGGQPRRQSLREKENGRKAMKIKLGYTCIHVCMYVYVCVQYATKRHSIQRRINWSIFTHHTIPCRDLRRPLRSKSFESSLSCPHSTFRCLLTASPS